MSGDLSTKSAAVSGWLKPAAEAAARGMLAIRRCLRCGRNHYPPRELCPFCLGDNLDWDVSSSLDAVLIARTVLHHSNEERFRARLPLESGLVQLECGSTAVVFLAKGCSTGEAVKVRARLDEQGHPVLVAAPPDSGAART
jgi:uncharacterized OB-fold protein